MGAEGLEAALEAAADAIRQARALVFTAGAGMGVDSGLPDFRGDEGFWRAYPPFRALGLSFSALANPEWFRRDPELAWGFYGHRLELYRKTRPHDGYRVLERWAKRVEHFVFTSNVDGAFQRAGFDGESVVECHGAIDFVQCTNGACSLGIVSADPYTVDVDPETFRARGELPKCERCSAILRPNIMMFGDWGFDGARSEEQERRFERWLGSVESTGTPLTVVECGAGTAIPTVRLVGERMLRRGARLIRINVREPEVRSCQSTPAHHAKASAHQGGRLGIDVPTGGIGIPLGARQALGEIERRLAR